MFAILSHCHSQMTPHELIGHYMCHLAKQLLIVWPGMPKSVWLVRQKSGNANEVCAIWCKSLTLIML